MSNQNITARAVGADDAVLNVIDTRPHFYINVEPKGYNGEYGCDWLKSEYVNPDKKVELTCGNFTKAPISTTISDIKRVYCPEEFYDHSLGYSSYYPTWFTFLVSDKEFKLTLITEKLTNTNIPNSTKIEFRCTSPNIEINRLKLNNTGNYPRESWSDNKEVKIKCTSELNSLTTIEMYAILADGTTPYLVGKIKLEPNNNIKDVELHFVHLIFSDSCDGSLKAKYDRTGNKSLHNILNYKSLNQLFVSSSRNNISTPQIIDLRSTTDGQAIINKYGLNQPRKTIYKDGTTYSERMPSTLGASTPSLTFGTSTSTRVPHSQCATNLIDKNNIDEFRSTINQYVQDQIPWFNNRLTDFENNRLKVVILINIFVQNTNGTTLEIRFGAGSTAGEAYIGGAKTPIYCDNLTKDQFSKTLIHEIGHLLGLDHPFDTSSPNFLQGYTDLYMDYEHNQFDNTSTDSDKPKYGGDIVSSKKRFSKSEWDLIN